MPFSQKQNNEPEFDITKMVWERKDSMAAQKQSKRKKELGEGSKEPELENLMISAHNIPNLYVAQPTNDVEEDDTLGSSDQDSYDTDPTEASVETSEDSSVDSSEENNPPIFMNQPREPEISEVDDDRDGMTDEPIPERRPEPTTAKFVRTGFHTFSLDDIKVSRCPQRIQDFFTWMVTKNLVEREKYMILSEFTSRFSGILRDWWNSLGTQDKNMFLTSQDFAYNIKILQEVFCGDTGQRQEKLRRQFFEMKCVAFDRDVIDIHFQKMAKMFFELGGGASLKKAFVSSLPKMLASRTMTIVEEKFQSIAIPPVGCFRQAIFLVLDDICTKRSVLKQIIRNNPALDKACRKSDLITGSSCSCHVPRRKERFKRFKWPRPSGEGSQFRRRTKYFRRRSPDKS